MRAVLALALFFQVTPCGAERNFQELRWTFFVCRQYDLAVTVSGLTSIKLGELCHGWH